jgi:hypothetical protein
MRDEHVYSVTLTETELKLFSEFLDQRNYGEIKKHNKGLKRAYELDLGYTAIGHGDYSKAHGDNALRAVRGTDLPKKSYVYGKNNKEALDLRITSGKPTNPEMLRDYRKTMPMSARVGSTVRRRILKKPGRIK